MDKIAGRYDTVGKLQVILRAEGWREDGFGRWTKESDVRTLVMEGSRVNGFYVAELRK